MAQQVSADDGIDLEISDPSNKNVKAAAGNSGSSGPGCGGPSSSSDAA